MKLFETQYKLNAYMGGTFGAMIIAEDLAQAQQFAALRGMGEKIALQMYGDVGPKPRLHSIFAPAIWEADYERRLKLVHELLFLLQMGVSANVVSIEQAFGGFDRGIMHEGIHMTMHKPHSKKEIDFVLDSIRWVEESIPGYYPSRDDVA